MSALLISVPQAAPVLGLSTRRAYQLAEAGELPGLRRLGKRTYRVSVPELEAFLGAPLPRPDATGADQ
jgi:excisionase family DNA binding protein